MTKTKFPELKDKFVELYNKGLSLVRISKELGISRETAKIWKNKLNLPSRPKERKKIAILEYFSPRIRQTVELWNDGLSLKEIAEKLHILPTTVEHYLNLARSYPYFLKYREKARRYLYEMRKGKRIKLCLRGFGGSGSYKRHSLLTNIFRDSGLHQRTLYFQSKNARLKFLVRLFKPYVDEIKREDKAMITRWLKDQFLSDKEIQEFYEGIGL